MSILFQKGYQVRDVPQLVRDSGGHRGSGPERLMDPNEVVVHEVKRDRMPEVIDLLRERVG